MTVSVSITTHVLRKQGVSSQNSIFHWAHDAAVIGRMVVRGEEIVANDGCWVMSRIGGMSNRQG